MNIVVSNLDDGNKKTLLLYKDMTLGWLLKLFPIRCKYRYKMMHPEGLTPTYLRAIHNGKTLFLSSSGKVKLHELGLYDGDEIVIGGVESVEKSKESCEDCSRIQGKNKKSKKKNGSKNKKAPRPAYKTTLTEEQLMEKYKEEHSKAMNPIFEELAPELKMIRNRLNNLALEKAAPKVRRSKKSNKETKYPKSAFTLLPGDMHGGKAGKTLYPVFVGDESNLYKTRKSLSRASIILDLHGCTQDEALAKLDKSLPIWHDIAMKGEYPWVIPVNIVCGGGAQILSEVVQNWIRTTRQVANRPKGLVSHG